jgi:hypothetical protein
MNKPTAVVVLCEDERTFSFAKRYLNKCGITGIRSKISPKGCGYDFVINEFANEVLAYRIANARKNTWLIAVVDADTGTVAQRLGKMDKALENSNEQRVKDISIKNERIARLVPRRNIETWIKALNSEQVNETDNYKYKKHDDEWDAIIPSAAVTFFAYTRQNAQVPENLIASLLHGVNEMSRVLQLVR